MRAPGKLVELSTFCYNRRRLMPGERLNGWYRATVRKRAGPGRVIPLSFKARAEVGDGNDGRVRGKAAIKVLTGRR